MALATERAAFAAEYDRDELYDGVKFVRLVEAPEPGGGST